MVICEVRKCLERSRTRTRPSVRNNSRISRRRSSLNMRSASTFRYKCVELCQTLHSNLALQVDDILCAGTSRPISQAIRRSTRNGKPYSFQRRQLLLRCKSEARHGGISTANTGADRQFGHVGKQCLLVSRTPNQAGRSQTNRSRCGPRFQHRPYYFPRRRRPVDPSATPGFRFFAVGFYKLRLASQSKSEWVAAGIQKHPAVVLVRQFRKRPVIVEGYPRGKAPRKNYRRPLV